MGKRDESESSTQLMADWRAASRDLTAAKAAATVAEQAVEYARAVEE